MKHLFLFSFFILSLNVSAQNCNGPMPQRMFDQQLQQLRANPNESSRMRYAMQVFIPHCLSSGQVFQVCRVLGSDAYCIDFAYAAYGNVVDPDNFYDVYDAFQLKSSAFRLHDMIHGLIVVQPMPLPEPLPPAPAPQPVVPVCEVTASEMAEIREQIKAATYKDSMENQAKMMIKAKQCFRADQIADLLSVLTYDDSKLSVAKFAYDYCIDTQNYYRVVNTMTFKSYQDDLTKFIQSRN